ncbi:MAG: hypothetical protein II709_02150, partial [Ruminococcus sp.]|nr:hypothetical protein [Ruminococcus sp.]
RLGCRVVCRSKQAVCTAAIACNFTLYDNMKIKVKQNIYDRKNDLALREKGAELEVSEQRGRAFCI